MKFVQDGGLCAAGHKRSVVRVGKKYFYRCPSCAVAKPKTAAKYAKKNYCESCGWTPPTKKVLHWDHIQPRSKGGLDDPSNRMTLCPNDHAMKTLRERGLLP